MKKQKTVKNLTIYHDADMDGVTSGILALKLRELVLINKSIVVHEDALSWDIIGYDYGKDSNIDTWLNLIDSNGELLYDNIQFIDITPPLEFITKAIPYMNENKLNIHIFDHHENAFNSIIEELNKNEFLININPSFSYFFDPNFSGAYIFKYFILNNNDWIFKLFGFYFNYVMFESKNIFIEFYKKTIHKHVDEFAQIKNTFDIEIQKAFNNEHINKFVDNVSTYDTWKWYESKDEKIPLALNEAFMQTWKSEVNEDLLMMVKKFFVLSDHGYTFSPYIFNTLLHTGYDIVDYKQNESFSTKHELVTFFDKKLAIINNRANFYDSENIKELYPNGDVVGVLYCNPEYVFDSIKLSIRIIDDKTDGNELMKLITENNGGGHKFAAGGKTKLTRFLYLIENQKQ